MSYARLRHRILRDRDRRQELLDDVRGEAGASVIFLSTAIPGPEKYPTGILPLARRVLEDLNRTLDRFGAGPELAGDSLGPFALLRVALEPLAAKAVCVQIEELMPATRLIDLDVHDADGAKLSRTALGLPARRCLLCAEAAVDCIRNGRHDLIALQRRVAEMLHEFRH